MRTRALFTKFCAALPIFLNPPPPHPHRQYYWGPCPNKVHLPRFTIVFFTFRKKSLIQLFCRIRKGSRSRGPGSSFQPHVGIRSLSFFFYIIGNLFSNMFKRVKKNYTSVQKKRKKYMDLKLTDPILLGLFGTTRFRSHSRTGSEFWVDSDPDPQHWSHHQTKGDLRGQLLDKLFFCVEE